LDNIKSKNEKKLVGLAVDLFIEEEIDTAAYIARLLEKANFDCVADYIEHYNVNYNN
jgi:hypothetical protein